MSVCVLYEAQHVNNVNAETQAAGIISEFALANVKNTVLACFSTNTCCSEFPSSIPLSSHVTQPPTQGNKQTEHCPD